MACRIKEGAANLKIAANLNRSVHFDSISNSISSVQHLESTANLDPYKMILPLAADVDEYSKVAVGTNMASNGSNGHELKESVAAFLQSANCSIELTRAAENLLRKHENEIISPVSFPKPSQTEK
jgi:hypothetical protein